MKKAALIPICLLIFATGSVKAQSIVNTSWKMFVGGEVNDTLTLHIRTDSSYVTDGMGNVVVRSLCKLSSDTLFLNDYEGNYSCPGLGTYKYSVNADKLTLDLISEQCQPRAENINGAKWTRVKEKPPGSK
jgi:hypothetical protein